MAVTPRHEFGIRKQVKRHFGAWSQPGAEMICLNRNAIVWSILGLWHSCLRKGIHLRSWSQPRNIMYIEYFLVGGVLSTSAICLPGHLPESTTTTCPAPIRSTYWILFEDFRFDSKANQKVTTLILKQLELDCAYLYLRLYAPGVQRGDGLGMRLSFAVCVKL